MTAYDASGDADPGVTVTFYAPSSSASGTFQSTNTNTVTVVTGSDGSATSGTFSANGTTGSYYVYATATVNGATTSAGFLLTNTAAGVVSDLTTKAGDDRSAVASAQFSQPLEVLVTDANGNPINDETVSFSIISGPGGASGTFVTGGATASVTTDSSGLATSPTLTANATAGSFRCPRRFRATTARQYFISPARQHRHIP